MDCELCDFKNPKGTATAVIIRDNKLLLLKRNEEPFKGAWDFPGGYMQEKETPEETIRREVKEELGIEAKECTFIKSQPGYGHWKTETYPILSNFFLVDIGDEDPVLSNENSEYNWVSLRDLDGEMISWDSNKEMAVWLKETFSFNLERVRALTAQLDSNARVSEQSLYKAILNGYVSTRYENDTLIGMGWIFPRQTLLRKQAVVEDMIVDEAYRGRGLGREILDDLVRWARENGVEVIELTSSPKRIAANELYKKYGFQLHPTNHYLYKVR